MPAASSTNSLKIVGVVSPSATTRCRRSHGLSVATGAAGKGSQGTSRHTRAAIGVSTV